VGTRVTICTGAVLAVCLAVSGGVTTPRTKPALDVAQRSHEVSAHESQPTPNAFAPAQQQAAGTSSRPAQVNAKELAQGLLEQGRASLASGDMAAGFEAFRRAVDYYPSAETHGALGDLYLRAAASSSAIFHLRRAADLDDQNADRWLLLANAYFLKPDLGAAWKAIERAKTVDPDIAIARDANNFVVRADAG
jgi:tetratricopeptide (TPR) repeat protein